MLLTPAHDLSSYRARRLPGQLRARPPAVSWPPIATPASAPQPSGATPLAAVTLPAPPVVAARSAGPTRHPDPASLPAPPVVAATLAGPAGHPDPASPAGWPTHSTG